MDERYKHLDKFADKILEIEIEGKFLKEHLNYDGLDLFWFYKQRLRNNLYDHRNFKRRGELFRFSREVWKVIQNKLIPSKNVHFDYVFLDRPLHPKFEGKKLKSEYYQTILENLDSSVLIVDLKPKEFIKMIFNKNHKIINIWSYYKQSSVDFSQLQEKVSLKAEKICKEFKIKFSEFKSLNELILNYYLPDALSYYETLKNLYLEVKPRKAAFSIQGSILSLMVLLSRKLGIETYSLQHGDIEKKRGHFFYHNTPKERLPDYHLVYSEKEKEIIGENIRVLPLGCPRYDYLKDYHVDTKKFREKYNIGKKKIIFWATQSQTLLEEENVKNCEVLMDSLRNSNYFLLIKLHPRENQEKGREFYQKFIEKYNLENSVVLKTEEEDTSTCMYVSEAVMFKKSSIGIEAILMNKPVIHLNMIKPKDWLYEDWFYEKEGIGMTIKNENEFIESLKKMDTKEFKDEFKIKREEFISKNLNNFGFSGKKIAEFMKKNEKFSS